MSGGGGGGHMMGGGGPTIRAGHGMVGGGDHYNMVNIKRPDSVITTSSIVSSSDTAPSEAGDSSAESTVGPMVGPPSAYAIKGLYGPQKQSKVPSGMMPSTSSASGGGVGVKDGKEGGPSASNVASVGEAN